jgi:TolA-binding protein
MMNDAGFFTISGYIKGMRSSLEKVIVLDPKHIKAKQLLVELYVTIPESLGGDKHKALLLAKQLTEQDPIEGNIAHANIHTHNENYIEAIKLLQTAVILAPARHQIIYDVAILMEKSGQHKAAVEAYLWFADKNTTGLKTTDALWRVGELTIDNKQHFDAGEQAMKNYIESMQSDQEKQGKGYLQLARIYQLQHKTAAAKSTLITAQKSQPNNRKLQKQIRKKLRQL